MINSKPLTLDIVSKGVSTPYALYDCRIINNRVFVGANWLKTLFLADVQYDDKKDVLSVSYMKPEEISNRIEELEKIIAPISADEALALWIRGQQTRTGTLQYSALSDELKEKAITQFSLRRFIIKDLTWLIIEKEAFVNYITNKRQGVFSMKRRINITLILSLAIIVLVGCSSKSLLKEQLISSEIDKVKIVVVDEQEKYIPPLVDKPVEDKVCLGVYTTEEAN